MKKLLCAAMVICLVLCTVACGGSKSSSKKVIVCGETAMNDICGVATFGVDYYNLGVMAGDMAAQILLEGKKPNEIKVGGDPNPSLSINETIASEIGFTIPESVKSKATAGAVNEVAREASAIVDANGDFTIGILQLVQHAALDQANKGFVDELSVKMKAAGKTMVVDSQNASGDNANNNSIAETFVSKKVDLIYTIATSSSQAAVAATSEIPIIFNAVTDPVDAGLVKSLDAAADNKNVTGVSDMNPVADQIDLIAELLGKNDITIGLLYTSAEPNSRLQIELAKKECEAKGFKYVVKGLGDINDLEASFRSLGKSVDAIYIPTDNTLANGAATIHSLNLGE